MASRRTLVLTSEVRLQWDPDHSPDGSAAERRTVQLGLGGAVLAHYVRDWIIDIKDISNFVAEQRPLAHEYSRLLTPREDIYPRRDP